MPWIDVGGPSTGGDGDWVDVGPGFVEPAPAAPPSQPEAPGGLGGFLSAFFENVVPDAIRHPGMVGQVPGAIQDLSASLPTPAAIPGAIGAQALSDIFGSASQASQEQFEKGNMLGGIGAAVPIIGPAAAQAGEEIGQGQTARGLGHAAGMLAPFAASGAVSLADKAAPALRASAEKSMGQFLGPTKEFNKAQAEKVIPRLLDEGISGSRAGVLEKAGAARKDAGIDIGALRRTQGARPVDTTTAADALEPLKQKLMIPKVGGGTGPATAAAEKQLAVIDGLQQTIRETEPSLRSVSALREILGKEVGTKNFMLGPDEQAAIKIKKAAYNALRDELHKTSPDLAALDKEFSFWKGVEDVLTQTQKRAKPQEGGLVGKGMNAASRLTGAVGLFSGDPALIGGAVVGSALTKLVTSPAWRSFSAVQKNQLARALANGNYGEALTVMGRGLGTGAIARPIPTTSPTSSRQ